MLTQLSSSLHRQMLALKGAMGGSLLEVLTWTMFEQVDARVLGASTCILKASWRIPGSPEEEEAPRDDEI